MNVIETMKQALELLDYAGTTPRVEARELIRAAIEQMEKAEPAAWISRKRGRDGIHYLGFKPQPDRSWLNIPLYTHPAPTVPEGWQLVPKELCLRQQKLEELVQLQHEALQNWGLFHSVEKWKEALKAYEEFNK